MICTLHLSDGKYIHSLDEFENTETKDGLTSIVLDLTPEEFDDIDNLMVEDGELVPFVSNLVPFPSVVLPTFTWTDPDNSTEYALSYSEKDLQTATQLKVWFDLGGGARDWKFENDVIVNVTQVQFESIASAAITQITSEL